MQHARSCFEGLALARTVNDRPALVLRSVEIVIKKLFDQLPEPDDTRVVVVPWMPILAKA